MTILITLSRFLLGGSETYTATVAEELVRQGHTVWVHARDASPEGRELLDSLGLRLWEGEPPPLERIDAVIAQDAANAYLLAGRRPGLPQLFVVHGFSGYERPPALMQPHPAVVVLNGRLAGYAESLAARPRVARLRQPIDLRRFRPPGPGRSRARRVLLLSNYLQGARLRMLENVCAELGLELLRRGALSTPTIAPQEALAEADIVVGYGRSAIEAMAMGRATYVWDYAGGDGWVTPESYPLCEDDGFSGAATDAIIDADRLRADLGSYRPELGEAAVELIRRNHSASAHAEALGGLLADARAPAPSDAFGTLAQLVRVESRAAVHLDRLEAELRTLLVEREVQRERAEAGERLLASMLASRSLRLTAPLRRAGTHLRR